MKQVLIRSTIAVSSGLLLVGLLTWAYHPIMVWLNGGKWCVTYQADGQPEGINYGKDCSASK